MLVLRAENLGNSRQRFLEIPTERVSEENMVDLINVPSGALVQAFLNIEEEINSLFAKLREIEPVVLICDESKCEVSAL